MAVRGGRLFEEEREIAGEPYRGLASDSFPRVTAMSPTVTRSGGAGRRKKGAASSAIVTSGFDARTKTTKITATARLLSRQVETSTGERKSISSVGYVAVLVSLILLPTVYVPV